MRRRVAVAVCLLLVTGCATAGGVSPRVHPPTVSAPVHIRESEFRLAVAGLMLALDLSVVSGEDTRYSLLASTGGVVEGARGRTAPNPDLGLLEEGRSLGPAQRRLAALSFALETVWDGAAIAVRDIANPAALRAMVVSLIGTALVMLVAPEPVTKFVAIALTASLIAYLGAGPVWSIGQAFLRLMEETQAPVGEQALRASGRRFGEVLGDNGARVLVLVALTALGGRSAMAAQGPRLPGYTQAALRAQAEGGFPLASVYAGEVGSLSLSSTGVVNVALAPTAVAAMAMGPGDGIQGDPEGDVHHICTDKNEVSSASGGPWTPNFEPYFRRAGMTLNDRANLVRIKGHKGPHPREYHQEVFQRIDNVMSQCRGTSQCRAVLLEELSRIARDLTTSGTLLRKLITKNPGA